MNILKLIEACRNNDYETLEKRNENMFNYDVTGITILRSKIVKLVEEKSS